MQKPPISERLHGFAVLLFNFRILILSYLVLSFLVFLAFLAFFYDMPWLAALFTCKPWRIPSLTGTRLLNCHHWNFPSLCSFCRCHHLINYFDTLHPIYPPITKPLTKHSIPYLSKPMKYNPAIADMANKTSYVFIFLTSCDIIQVVEGFRPPTRRSLIGFVFGASDLRAFALWLVPPRFGRLH